jgi:hypothetical protein
MIISHRHRFIFIKTFKTAGSSVEIALSTVCGPEDVITPLDREGERLRRRVAGVNPRGFLEPWWRWDRAAWTKFLAGRGLPKRFDKHMPARDVRTRLHPAIWDSYVKFTIVRDPFDAMVSRYHYHLFYSTERPSFEEWLRRFPHVINQNWQNYTADEQILVDVCIRYESLAHDLNAIGERLELQQPLGDVLSGIRAKAGFRPPGEAGSLDTVMTRRAAALIRLLAASEIETFGYHEPQLSHPPGDESARAEALS